MKKKLVHSLDGATVCAQMVCHFGQVFMHKGEDQKPLTLVDELYAEILKIFTRGSDKLFCFLWMGGTNAFFGNLNHFHLINHLQNHWNVDVTFKCS